MGNCIINRIGGGTTYSENEQRIGTWIDGKPIYRKLLVNNGTVQSGQTLAEVSLPNYDSLVKLYGSCTDSNHANIYPIPSNISGNMIHECYIFHDNSNGKYKLSFINSEIIKNVYLWIEYTKTTDKSGGGI